MRIPCKEEYTKEGTAVDDKENTIENLQERTVYFDFLRVLAAFSVVIVHVSAYKYYEVEVKTWEWQIFNIYNSVFRWTVPIFVMISGALFLNGDYSVKKIYKKNIARIMISFAFWSAIYTAVFICVSHCGWKEALENFFLGDNHLWFLYMLTGLYMIVPLLKTMVSSKKLVEYFLVLSLIFNFFVPQLLAIISLKYPYAGSVAKSMAGYMSFHFALGYVGYFVGGYYLSKIELSKMVERIIYILGLCGFAMTIIGTAALSFAAGKADITLYDSMAVNVMLESIAVFIFVKETFQRRVISEKVKDFLGVLSKYSFGVYLVHLLILRGIERLFGFHTLSFCPVVSVPVISIAVFVISLLLSAIFHRIPILKKVV